MFRRSRFSIRPNVGTAGRTPATTQDATSVNQEASENPQSVSESSTATAVTDNKSVVTPSEKPTAPGDGNDQNGEGTSSSAAVQRRKRFSIKPKVAPGRPSSLARTPKSPVKAVSETLVEVPCSELDKSTTSSQTGTTAAPQGLKSPRRRRPSEESKQPTEQPKPTLISSDNSGRLAVSPAEDSLEQIHLPADSGKQLEITSNSQVKEVPPRLPEKAPPSLPDKEHIEISEKAKTLVSSKSGLSLSPPAFSLSRLLNDPSDLQRLAKAQKLRELLRQEMHKEKKIKKTKARAKEFTLDPAKMTMRDLIRYLPVSNPMTSSLEDSAQENETVVPPSPGREVSPERAQELEVHPKIASPREEEEEEAEEEQEEALMVPQVKVAEDGSLIIDEESLTVEVQRAKGPNPAQERDPIFERGSTTTYSSFRKGTHSKPWSSEETDMFFLAVSMVGTDFSMICQLFPHRARSEIKNKFKKEERENAWRIDKAFRERRKLDIEYFSKLLDKIMEVQKNRKKLKSLAEKNSPKKHKRKAKGKAAKKLSDVEEENEEVENKIPDLEEEGEKENEDLCNEGGTPVSKPKKKRKRNNRQEALTEEPNDKKNKTGEKSNEQDDAYTPEDAEAALPEDRTNFDISDKTESMNSAKDTAIKPAKLSRGRAPKPVLPLGRKWGKKPPPPSTKAKDTAPDKGDESVSDEASKKQVDNDTSPLRQATKRSADDISSEEEDATVQPPRPTRYGRVPKPTKPLTYPAKESAHSSASETTPASPGVSAPRPKHKCTAKRGRLSKSQSSQESKKPKLVTLRASQSEYSDEENENQWDEEEMEEEQHPACSSSKDSIAPVFVPVSLRSPHPVISEVEETMEELDILANIPDVLGISQDALCPDASFELAQNDTEPCEHQLDLLVDVIDFLSSEHTEASEDESYNEAAQTLLTIGNLAHLSQSAQNQIATQDHISGTTSVSVKETSQHLEEEILSKPAAQEENSAVPHMAATPGHGVTETSETIATVELQNRTKDDGETSVLWTDSDMDPNPQLQSSPESSKKNSPKTRRGRVSKVKPKPNLDQASKTAQSKFQPETSTVRTAEESHTIAPQLSQATETAAKVSPKIADCSQQLLKDEIKLTKEPSSTQLEPILEQATRHSRSTSESKHDILMSNVGTTKSSYNLVTFDPVVTESHIGQGTNIDSAPVQESSDHLASCFTPAEDLPVSQKEESEETPTRQTRKSRFQKVKPKPNLTPTSRTVHSKPQTTKDTLDKDSNPTLNPKLHEKATVELEAEPTCTASPEKPSQSTGPASDLLPSLDLGSNLTPTEELYTRDIVQVESDAATSDHSASENRNFFDSKFESSVEQNRDARPTSTDEKTMSHAGTTESSCSNPLTSDSATGSQVGQDSNIESALVQESSDHPAPRVTPIEGLPVSQEEVMDIAPTRQTRKSRFQKVKPKPNLVRTSRTVHSKPQTTKDTLDKDSNPTLNPKLHEKATVELEAEPTCTASPEKPSQSTGPASDLLPSLDLGSNLTPTEELYTQDIVHVESDAATSDQSVLENQNFSYAQFESSVEQDTRNTRPTSTDEKPMSQAGTTESTCSNPLTSCSATGSQVGKDSNIESAPVQESSEHPAPCVTPVEEVLVSQKEGMDTASTCQTRRGRLQKVKPKLSQISRTVWSKPQTTKDPVTYMLVEKPSNPPSRPESTDNTITEGEAQPTCSSTPPEKPGQIKSTTTDSVSVPLLELDSTHKSTEEFHSTEAQKTNVGSALDLNSEGSEQNAPQRRQRFPKVKPNLGSSTRTTQAKLHLNYTSKPSEQYHMDTSSNVTSEQLSVDKNDAQTELKLAEKNSKHLTSTHCSLHSELLSSTNLGPSESLDSTNDERTSSDCITIATSWVAENQSMLTDSVLELRGSETPTFEEESIGDTMSNNDKVEAGPGSQWDCKQDLSIRVTATNTQLTDDPTAVSNVQSSEDGSTVSKMKSILPTYTQSKPDAKESTQQPRSENDSEVQSQDAVQQCSETTKTNQTSAQSDDNQSEKTDSSKSSRKAPQTRRGRLVKPKPNLAPSSRPPKPQQVRNTKKAGSDSGTHSEGVDASVSHKSVSELRPDFQQPVEGPIEQQSIQNPHPNDAASSIGCLTQAPDNSTQDASTSITGETQSLTIFPDLLSEQVPSDPDEPFFILSLTEIPVCSSGEVVDSVCEPFPYLPVTDTSIQQQSVLGESLAAAGHGSLSNVAVPVSMEESGETGLINVIDFGPDPAAYKSLMENPVDPHERTTVQSSEFPETVENIDESEIPPTTQRLMGTRRGAKLQVTSNTTTTMRASKTLAAKESIPVQANTTQDSELAGPSVQPKAINELITEPQKRSCEHIDIEKETLIDGKDHENSSSGAQTAQTRRTSSRNRKSEVLPAFPSETKKTAPSSDSPPGKASSKGRKVKTPRAAGKRSTQAPVASTYDVTPTPSPTLPQEETHLILPPTSPTQTEMDIKQTSEHSQLCSDPTYSTSQCTAEGSQVSDVVESSYIEEEEPTSVSQYFLSDIFTEVEEG
ncbi:transcription factor TFIIIB component B'' homolog isoform X2 [Micropterus dolomieu]|uniref:transcription factor TFIIIB component B'' homolog isoform X2 n=1 Tax=Micropterus dolomieu TaxID=147949 RepID=UPI001E8D19C8|nr:transcription factor TFIIIB component B'' homolog isoform X2 [Micropterus dolomieu]